MTQHFQFVLLCCQKLRDSRSLNIASYYLKTLFLWEIEKNKDPDFWKMKQGPLFMHVRIIHSHLNICNFLRPCSVCCQSFHFEAHLQNCKKRLLASSCLPICPSVHLSVHMEKHCADFHEISRDFFFNMCP